MNDTDLAIPQRDILDFERTWWCEPGSKEAAIRARLGLSKTQYYRQLAALLEHDGALQYDPLTVKRLLRRREMRRRARFVGRQSLPGTR